MDSILLESSLPLKYVAFSHCFRTEAGAAGAATRYLEILVFLVDGIAFDSNLQIVMCFLKCGLIPFFSCIKCICAL